MSGGVLVAGTTSDAGKSVLTAGICRWLYRQGVRVAPFKAQNMSNNSVVVPGPEGRGGEVGRAQALQAAACGIAPEVRFNPVLLKPGTVADLAWLRETGLADAVQAHAACGKPLLGICGGFQMLAQTIRDEVESGHGTVPGLGLLPVNITFAPRKTLCRSSGSALGAPVVGYENHHGYVSGGCPAPFLRYADGRPEGAVVDNVAGTHWHGTFESDEFRRRFLTRAARLAGRHGFTVAADTRFAAVRERAVDVLGDLVEEHLDTAALRHLIDAGPPSGLPFLPPGAPDES